MRLWLLALAVAWAADTGTVAGDPVAGDPVAGDPVAGDPVAGEPVVLSGLISADEQAELDGVQASMRSGAAWCTIKGQLSPWEKEWCAAIPPGCAGMEASCAEAPPRGCQEEPLPDLDLPVSNLPWDEILQALAITAASLLLVAAIRAWWLGREPEEEAAEEAPAAPLVRLVEEAPPGEDPLADAQAAAGAGDIGRALLILRRAVLTRLAAESRVVLHPSRTDREYVRALSAQPEVAADLRAVVQAVEQHRYAGRPVAPGVFAGAMEAARRLLAAALPALLVAGLVSGLIGAAQAALSGHGLVVELLTGMGYTRRDPASYFDKPDLIFFDASVGIEENSVREFLKMVEDGADGVIIVRGGMEGLPPEVTVGEIGVGAIQSRIGPVASPIRLVEPIWSVGGAGEILAVDEAGSAVMRQIPLGQGQLIVAGAPGLILDVSVLHRGNAELLYRIAKHADAWSVGVFEGEMLSPSPVALLLKAGLLPAAGQGFFVFLLACWWRGRRFNGAQDPPEQRRRDMTEHLQAVGGFYRSHGAHRQVLVASAQWALGWMRRRLRVEDRDLVDAVVARSGEPRARVERVMLRARQAIARPDEPGDEGDIFLQEELWELMDGLKRAGQKQAGQKQADQPEQARPSTPSPESPSPASPTGSGGWSRR